MKILKQLAALSAFAVFLAGGSVVYGGLSWTGMDPVVRLADGRIVNVELAAPPRAQCPFEDAIEVLIEAPLGATLVSEHNGPCGVTETQLSSGDDDSISVDVLPLAVSGGVGFPLEVMISVEGVERATCVGNAKHGVSCDIVLDDEDDDGGGGDEDDDDDEDDD